MTHPQDPLDPLDRLNQHVDPPTRYRRSAKRGFRLPDFKHFQLSPRTRRNLLVGVLATFALVLAFLAAAWSRACAGNTCPSIEELGGYDPNQASKVDAADGRLITDLGLERRTVIPLDRKSTRLNSSHANISYALFCLKKKKYT